MKFGYIKKSNKDITEISRDDVTIKGIIAAQIDECNQILLTEMISQHLFDDLTYHEIVALLAIFIDDIKQDNALFSSINCSPNVINRIKRVQSMIEQFINVESKLGINIYMYGYWDIYYDYVNVAYAWASGCTIQDVLKYIKVYEGNFIRE